MLGSSRSTLLSEHRQALITAAVTGELRDPWSSGVSKVDEAAFEAFICDWLVGSGGYDAVKVGTAQGADDFDPVRGLDTAELFAFIGATQATSGTGCSTLLRRRSEQGAARASPTGWPRSSTPAARSTCSATASSTRRDDPAGVLPAGVTA